jgi:hypothetical protein
MLFPCITFHYTFLCPQMSNGWDRAAPVHRTARDRAPCVRSEHLSLPQPDSGTTQTAGSVLGVIGLLLSFVRLPRCPARALNTARARRCSRTRFAPSATLPVSSRSALCTLLS